MKEATTWAIEMHSIGCDLPYPFYGYKSLEEHILAIQDDAREDLQKQIEKERGEFIQSAFKQQLEIEQLQWWKKEALIVMPDAQAIGKLLNLPPGTEVHKVLIPKITQLLGEIKTYRKVIDMAWEDRRDDSPVEYVGKLAEAKCNLPER